jgi:hypothetical protein
MIFKIGDRVRVTKDQAYGAIVNNGDLGTIANIEGTESYVVEMDESRVNYSNKWHFRSDVLELVQQTAKTEAGIKYDNGKAPISLIPVEAILAEAQAFDYGAKKYAKHNFRLGMDHTRVLDAAMRHILAIVAGEDTDPESGLPHYAHARACLGMYAYFVTNNAGTDDRYGKYLEEILKSKQGAE